MKRRDFLVSTAGIIGAAGLGSARQAPAGGGGPISQLFPGRANGPAPVAAHKLARISLMQLQFEQYQRPFDPKVAATPEQTLTVFDLPKMYVDLYGCHNIEFQLNNVVQSETDPDFIKRLKAALDQHQVTMSQINMEIGRATGMTADAAGRRQGLDRLKKWIDIANQYGCKRLMLNQDQANLRRTAKRTPSGNEGTGRCRPVERGYVLGGDPRRGHRGARQQPRHEAVGVHGGHHRGSRGALEHRHRQHQRGKSGGTARLHQAVVQDIVGQHAHQIPPELLGVCGRPLHGVPRLQGPVRAGDSLLRTRGYSCRLQRGAGGHCVTSAGPHGFIRQRFERPDGIWPVGACVGALDSTSMNLRNPSLRRDVLVR